MVDVNVEFTLGNENPINAEFTLEPDVTYLANIVTATFSGEHNQLIHREYPDQHPIEAITGLTEGLNNLSSAIDDETARAENAENILNGKIDDEISRAILAEGNLSDRITSEVNRATEKENQLADDILAENNRALSAEETLQDNIDNEEDRAKDAEQNLSDDISEEVNNRTSEITRVEGLISDEETRAKGIEQGLRDDLTAEVGRATIAEGALQTNITAEENRAKGVEQQLASSIDSNHQAISNHVSNNNNPHEVTKAQVGLGNVENLAPADMPMSTATKTYIDNADSGLQGQITAINTTIGGYGNIVTHNVSEFATANQGDLADTSLQPNDNISELTNNLNYQTATQVANSIAVETNNRESADNNLQSQIDAIVSASDVFDIVGTYAELQAYDISTVPVNDIIKVLEDSTHGGAATYYRCVENNNVKSWSYIGSEGASYTKAEADNKFVPQTRTVNNKALSSDITLTASDVGALPSSTVIPTVNDATVTIQKNGSTVSTFTLNQSSNETVNITVPTKTSDITNDSGYITSASLPTVNNGQLNIQVNGSSIATFTANQSGNTTANIVVPDSATWGNITGTLSDQTDLQDALNAKANSASLATVATSGSYNDLSNKPTIPTVNNATLTIQKNGTTVNTFTANASSNVTANIIVPTDTNELTNGAGFITGITSSDVTTALGYTPADDSGVVKTTGNQTVTGIKSFSSRITRSSTIDMSTTSGETEVQTLATTASNGTTVASYNATRSGTFNTNRQRVTNPNVSGASWFDLRVIVSDSAFGYASVECGAALTNRSLSYATSSTTLTCIPTMGWVNNPSTSTNVLHRSGTETASGDKTFSGTVDFTGTTTTITQATSDSSNKIATTAFVKAQNYVTNSTLSSSPYLVLVGTSSTAGDATAKIVEISTSYETTPTISAGQILIVTPTTTSTVADSTITIQKTVSGTATTLLTAKTMRYNNANITTGTDSIVWSANIPSIFMYDGTYWQFLGHGLDNNTTYSAMSVAEGIAGTATNNRAMRADYLKQILDNRIQLVSSLPATPESNILYCIPES